MPIYEYHCGNCNKDFEKLVSISADADKKVTCSFCGSSEIEKKISCFAFSVSNVGNTPSCSDSCRSGFDNGTCGSGMCCGHGH